VTGAVEKSLTQYLRNNGSNKGIEITGKQKIERVTLAREKSIFSWMGKFIL
jgi:hypothetical protein